MPHKDSSGNAIQPNRNLEIIFPFPDPKRQVVAAHTLSGIKQVLEDYPEVDLGIVLARWEYRMKGNPPERRLCRAVPTEVELMMPAYLRNPVAARMTEMLTKLGFKSDEFEIKRMDYS